MAHRRANRTGLIGGSSTPDSLNHEGSLRLSRKYRGLVASPSSWPPSTRCSRSSILLIFRHVIDNYATRFAEYTTGQFFRGVGLLLAAAVGVAFVSRVAKNFQDYFINVITQRLGARALRGRHPPLAGAALPGLRGPAQRRDPGQAPEGAHRRGEAHPVAVNVLFTTLVGIVFVMVYAFTVHWLIAPVYFLTVPMLGS